MIDKEPLCDGGSPAEHVSPASFQQARLFRHEKTLEASGGVPPNLVHRFRTGLDVGAMESALSTLVARHEALRTSFAILGDVVVQVVRAAAPVVLHAQVVDGVDGASDDERDARLAQFIEEAVREPFDLATGPAIRTRLFEIGTEHVLLIAIHHIAFDRWSHALFSAELAELYRSFRTNDIPRVPELPLQYRDYAAWQLQRWESGALTDHVAYWRDRLSRRPEHWGLPTDRAEVEPGPAPAGAVPIDIPQDVAADLVAAGRQLRASESVVLLAAFATALAGWTGSDHVLVSSPVANRSLPDTEHLIGCFVNMVPLQATLVPGESFGQLVRRLRGDVFDAYDHQDLFFNHLVESVPEDERGALASVVFAYDDATTPLWKAEDLGEPVLSGVEGPARYDLSVVVQRTATGIRGSANFPVTRFDRATVEVFVNQLVTVVRHVVRNLDEPLHTPHIGTPADERS